MRYILKKYLLVFSGLVSVALGVIGIIMPLVPTTPFMLLAAACFLKSSPRLHTWLTGHPLFGRYILSYQLYRAVSVRVKIATLIMLWASILSSAFLVVSIWPVRIVLLFIATGVTVHVLSLNNLTEEMALAIGKRIRVKRKN